MRKVLPTCAEAAGFVGIGWLATRAYISRLSEDSLMALPLAFVIVVVGTLLILTRKGLHRGFRHFLIYLLAAKVLLMATLGKDLYVGMISSYDGFFFESIGKDLADTSVSISAFFHNVSFNIGVTGSGNLGNFIGLIYYFTVPSFTAAHMVFASFGLWAIYLAYKGIRLAFPEIPWRRYVYLLALLPSVFVFSSLVLKDAPALAFLCLFLYGSAVLFRRSVAHGVAIVCLSIAGMFYVRPYMPLIMVVALAAGILSRPWRLRADILTPFFRGALLIVFAMVFLVSFITISRIFLQVEAGVFVTPTVAFEKLGRFKEVVAEQKAENPAHSGLHLEGRSITSLAALIYLPWDMMSIFFRPFIWEVYNLNSLLASVENLFLLYVFYRIVRARRSIIRLYPGDPLIVVMFVFVILFGLGFTLVAGNLGTAFRIKGMTYPFLLALYSVAEWSARTVRMQLSPRREMLAE